MVGSEEDEEKAAESAEADRLERRGDGASIVALFALRGELRVDLGRADLEVLAFGEDPCSGGAAPRAPIEGVLVTLSGPAALILTAPGA